MVSGELCSGKLGPDTGLTWLWNPRPRHQVPAIAPEGDVVTNTGMDLCGPLAWPGEPRVERLRGSLGSHPSSDQLPNQRPPCGTAEGLCRWGWARNVHSSAVWAQKVRRSPQGWCEVPRSRPPTSPLCISVASPINGVKVTRQQGQGQGACQGPAQDTRAPGRELGPGLRGRSTGAVQPAAETQQAGKPHCSRLLLSEEPPPGGPLWAEGTAHCSSGNVAASFTR